MASDFELAYNLTAAQLLGVPSINHADHAVEEIPSVRQHTEHSASDQGKILAALQAQQLQNRADVVRRQQDAWYNEILHQSRSIESSSRELLLQAKEHRDQRMRQELEAYQQWMEQIQAEQQARLAEEAQQRRLALDRQRAHEAAEEARRARLAAEEEQRRRERERQCVVCLESNDMGDMVEISCRHWYCPDHLRGEGLLGVRSYRVSPTK